MEWYNHHVAALTTPPEEAAGKQPSLDRLLKDQVAKIWSRFNTNEWGRLIPNGVGKYRPKSERIAGTGTLFLNHKLQVPEGQKITYANWVCNIRPQKSETHRVQMTSRGDRLD